MSKIAKIVYIILILAFLVFAGFFIYRKYFVKPEVLTPTPKPTLSQEEYEKVRYHDSDAEVDKLIAARDQNTTEVFGKIKDFSDKRVTVENVKGQDVRVDLNDASKIRILKSATETKDGTVSDIKKDQLATIYYDGSTSIIKVMQIYAQ